MDSPTVGAASPTYQCVVCQSTCLTPNELHRHQSYRHTPEELSLSIIGVHNAAIRTFDLPNGIVYDNSWLYDPNRHAAFYTYSANMLCDDNNNGDVVDYAFKAFEDRVVEESGPVAIPDDEDCTHDDVDRSVDEKYDNENFVEAQNFERESWVGESKILDLRLKIDLEVETETHMDTAGDNFWGFGEAHSGEWENLGRDDKKSVSSDRCPIKTCVKSLDVEQLQTCVPDGLASKILDLGRKVFSEVQPEIRTDDAAANFGVCREGLHSDSGNRGRDIGEKLQNQQNETCVKVQNFNEPQTCVQDFEILDLSQKFCSEVQPETRMDTAPDILWKRYTEIRSDIENPRGETAKRRSTSSECLAKSKARKLTTPRMKLDNLKRAAAKPENAENTESGNIDTVKQELQDSLSWFESEASKIKRYNDKVKQIRASQKKALNLTRVARKQVKGEGSGKAKKRTMQSCGSGDAIQLSGSFDCEDLLGFDGKGATISARCSRNAKRLRISKKKGKICEPEADKSAEETAELRKRSLHEETVGEAGITGIRTEHSLTFGSDQSLIKFKSKKSKIHTATAGKAEKPKVLKKKGKNSEIEVDNSPALPKREPEVETAGPTEITLHSAEHSSIINPDQSLLILESGKSKIRVTTSGNAKKPRVSKKKGKISETVADHSAGLLKRPPEEETVAEARITQICAEHSLTFDSDQSLFNFKSKKSKIHTSTVGKTKKLRVSGKKGVIGKTEAANSAELPKRLTKEETAGETEITLNSAEHSSIIGSDQSSFNLENSKSTIRPTTSGNAKKPRVSKKKGKICETEVDNSAELPKRPSKEKTAGETEITLHSAEHSSIIGSDQSLFNLESSKSKIHVTTSGNPKEPRVSKKKGKISETEADSSADETADLLKKLFQEETAGETVITQNQDKGDENCAKRSSIFSYDKYSSHCENKKSKVHATTSGSAKTPRVSRKKEYISETETDNSADETAELLKKLLEEETAGETQITQNQDNGNGNPAESSSIFASAESTFHFESKEAKIAMASSVNAKNPIASTNLETAAEEPAKPESTKPAHQDCAKEVRLQINWDCKSKDSSTCLDKDRPKIKAMCAENAVGQAEETAADEPVKHESVVEIENGADQNCAQEVGLQANWDCKSADFPAYPDEVGEKINPMHAGNAGEQAEKSVADKPAEQESTEATEKGANQKYANEVRFQPNWVFDSTDILACSDGDGQKINPMHAENAGAQTENIAIEENAELLKDLLTEPSEEETPQGTEKLQNQDYENGNCAEQSSIFGSADSAVRLESKEANIGAKMPITSTRKAQNPKTEGDKPTEQETTKPANQKCAKEVRPWLNWDFESADFLACSDRDGQNINTTYAENDGAQGEKAAVEVTAELLRDLLTQPTEEETSRMTEKLQSEDYENEDYAGEGSFFSSDEYLYYFPSEEAKMAAMSSGYAKKPIASVNKSNTLKTVTVGPARQKMTRKIVNDGNGNSSKQSSGSSRNVFSYMGCASEEATVTPPIASGKKSNLKPVTVWAAKQKMTRKIVSDGNGNSSKQSSDSTPDVFSYTGSESDEVTITPISKFRAERSSALGKKPKKINAGDENCAGHCSNYVPDIYTCTDRATKKVETLNAFGKKPKKINTGDKNCAGHSSNFFPNYTCTYRANKQVAINVPFWTKPKKLQVTSKKSTNSETLSDKPVVKETARRTTKLFYRDFGSEISVSQTSPPIIDVNSSTESGSEQEMPKKPARNFGKSIVARNKSKNLETPEVEPAMQENSENREYDNVISLYKDSTLIPGGSSACDNDLPPVTFVAYPPYVDENSILVLNPESRELVWKSLETEDSQLEEPTNFRWVDRGSQQNFSETGKASTSRKVGGEKSASIVPAAIGAPASNEESTLQKTNVRRSTRPRKAIQRYNS